MAAADYAAGRDIEPPSELIDLWDWRDTGTPKVAGGRDDQPAGLLRKGKYLEAVYRVMQQWYRHGGRNFNKSEREIFNSVLRLRREHANTRRTSPTTDTARG